MVSNAPPANVNIVRLTFFLGSLVEVGLGDEAVVEVGAHAANARMAAVAPMPPRRPRRVMAPVSFLKLSMCCVAPVLRFDRKDIAGTADKEDGVACAQPDNIVDACVGHD